MSFQVFPHEWQPHCPQYPISWLKANVCLWSATREGHSKPTSPLFLSSPKKILIYCHLNEHKPKGCFKKGQFNLILGCFLLRRMDVRCDFYNMPLFPQAGILCYRLKTIVHTCGPTNLNKHIRYGGAFMHDYPVILRCCYVVCCCYVKIYDL